MDSLLFMQHGIALLLASLILPGTLLLALLSLAGLWQARKVRQIQQQQTQPVQPSHARILLLVPAHNEQSSILTTIASLELEAARDQHCDIIVIADNCTDDTALLALSAGVEVLQRHNQEKRGKGYALDFAFSHVLQAPEYADVAYFVVVDADSQVDAGFLRCLREHFAQGAMVVQARYTVLNAQDSIRTRLMQLALSGFNVLRPLGRMALGCSAGILGNGFALRREILQNIPYTAGSLVEDIEYHLILVWHGVQVQFAYDAVVRGEMPHSSKGAASQRARWEGGRLRLLLDHAPSLLVDVLRGRKNALEPLLDLLLLPLSYHLLLLCLLALLPMLWAKALALSGLAVLLLHVLAAARVAQLPRQYLLALLYVPFYLLWKMRQLPAILASAKRNAPWQRSQRQSELSSSASAAMPQTVNKQKGAN